MPGTARRSIIDHNRTSSAFQVDENIRALCRWDPALCPAHLPLAPVTWERGHHPREAARVPRGCH